MLKHQICNLQIHWVVANTNSYLIYHRLNLFTQLKSSLWCLEGGGGGWQVAASMWLPRFDNTSCGCAADETANSGKYAAMETRCVAVICGFSCCGCELRLVRKGKIAEYQIVVTAELLGQLTLGGSKLCNYIIYFSIII